MPRTEVSAMSIPSNQMLEPSETVAWTLPVARRPWPLEMLDPQPAAPWSEMGADSTFAQAPPANGPSSAGAASSQSLTSLIAQLSRQLRAIERTFMSALRDLATSARSVSTNTAAQAPSSNGQTAQARGSNPYDGLIRRTAARHDLDPALLSAVIKQESGFDPSAHSSAGAMGLMQLMPDTAKSLGVTNAYDPAQNVEGGATMLRGLIDRYGGRLDLALAAYNAGSGAVDKYHGVPPFRETRSYVQSILADYKISALRA
jgi:soluble lytic murein transglycosylase-like protein